VGMDMLRRMTLHNIDGDDDGINGRLPHWQHQAKSQHTNKTFSYHPPKKKRNRNNYFG